MTRFERQASHHRIEVTAGLLILALVVGLPILSNYSGVTAGAATGHAAASAATDSTTVIAAGSALTGAEVPAGELPVDGLPARSDSTFWDIYQEVGGLLGDGLAPVAPVAGAPPRLVTTTTTLPIVMPAATPIPIVTPRPTTPTTSIPVKKASVPRPPGNLLVDFGSPSLNVRWDPVSTNTDGTAFADFQTYEVSFSATDLSKTYETTSPSFTYPFEQNRLDFGTPQAELTVTVRAVAHTGIRSDPLTGVATNEAPPTPTAPPLLVSDPDSPRITVTEPEDQGPISDLAGFEIYQSESASGPFELLASTVGWDSFIHEVVTGTTHHYLYKIRDVFGQVSPGFSPTASVTAS